MGSPYQSQSVTGYNSSPPPDDGSTTASNKISWATIKSKITDPLNTAIAAINTALRAALNISPSTTGVNYTTVKGDHLTTVEFTAGVTISLGDAASMIADTVGYKVTVYNKGTSSGSVALASATDTLAGRVNGTVALPPGASMTFTVAASGVGYDIVSSTGFAPFLLSSVSGTNTITAAAPSNLLALYAGLRVRFTPAGASTTAATLNITPSGGSALTAKNIFAAGAAMVGGELQAVPVDLEYDGTQWNLLGFLNINGLTVDSSPDTSADYAATYDASATAYKKVLLKNIGAVKVKAGSFTRDTSTASGTQAITGVGFTPKAMVFFGGEAGASAAARLCWGFDDSSGRGALNKDGNGAYALSANSLYFDDFTGGTYAGTVTAFGADGFTVTWVKGGSPTGTVTIKYLAIG